MAESFSSRRMTLFRWLSAIGVVLGGCALGTNYIIRDSLPPGWGPSYLVSFVLPYLLLCIGSA